MRGLECKSKSTRKIGFWWDPGIQTKDPRFNSSQLSKSLSLPNIEWRDPKIPDLEAIVEYFLFTERS